MLLIIIGTGCDKEFFMNMHKSKYTILIIIENLFMRFCVYIQT